MRKQLLSPTALNNDQFGYSVSLHRDKLVVGVPFSGIDNQSKYGNAYAYARNTGGTNNWGALQNLTRADPANNDQFGIAVVVGQDTAVVGANQTDALGLDSGSVYIYRLKYNNAPQLVIPISNQVADTNTPFAFTVAAGTFADPDVGDTLTLSATLADGSPLPAWLSFNAATATFSGTPTIAGTHSIRLTASDEDSASVSAPFSICVSTLCIDAAPPSPPYLIVARDVPNGQLLLRYLRPAGALSSRYQLQVSVNCVNWNPGNALIVSETIALLDAVTEEVTLRITQPANAAQFFRIQTTSN